MENNPKMSAEEKKWQAQQHARVLMDAERIKSEPKLLQAAAKEARVIADSADKAAAQAKAAAAKIQPGKPAAKPAAKLIQKPAPAKPTTAKRSK